MGLPEEMLKAVEEFGSGPLLSEMPRYTLADKMQDGPTAAHRIEEIHTPYNFAYITCTTGTSAFQNLVGVTKYELPARKAAGLKALKAVGLRQGDHLLITYPPLVSVFSPEVFEESGIEISFIKRPSRDALLAALCALRPAAVLGESSFLRAALADAGRMGLRGELPDHMIMIAAGSPMDPGLREEADRVNWNEVHDLYGCQEFGWLCLDGVPLREDVFIWDSGRQDGRRSLIVGGLPTEDCFYVREDPVKGMCIDTPSRVRAETAPETEILASTAADVTTVQRAARSILRIKGRIVRVSGECVCRADATVLRVFIPGTEQETVLTGPGSTRMFDDLLEAQKAYQREARTDPVWNKPC